MLKNKIAKYGCIFIALVVFSINSCLANSVHKFWNKSFALVVGIDRYNAQQWRPLQKAVSDAKRMSKFLQDQGFHVKTLLNEQATARNIKKVLMEDFPSQISSDDRVLFYFAGHGYTEKRNDIDFGYIVPHDGLSVSSYISMDEVKSFAQRMGEAKHHLYIMDACYGGVLGNRGPTHNVNDRPPSYIRDMNQRPAQQIITAGGADQVAVDGLFTRLLIEGIEKGYADTDGDKYVTYPELLSYVTNYASTEGQTPGSGTLPGDRQGQFTFLNPRGTGRKQNPIVGGTSRGQSDHQVAQKNTKPEDLRSIKSDQKARLQIKNVTNDPAEIYWVDYQGEEKYYMRLLPNASYTQETYATHPWVARDATNKEFLGHVVAGPANTIFEVGSGVNQGDRKRQKYQWLYGTYVRHPFENGYHEGTIGFAGTDNSGKPVLVWSNSAGYSWKLYPDNSNQRLLTRNDNPYFDLNPATGKTFELVYNSNRELAGFKFQTELYSLVTPQ